jgi:hypothetical protein
MKKIKKFRVKARLASVLKGLKALTGDTRVTPELEQAVEGEIDRAPAAYATAALYETVTAATAPDWAAELMRPAEGVPAPVALTLFVSTIGPGLEEELGNALSRGEALRSQILTAVGDDSAEQTAAFVQRLVAEEAEEEACELSARVYPPAEELRRRVLSLLSSDKIGIQMDSLGHLTPRFTRTGYVTWSPPSKKKRDK